MRTCPPLSQRRVHGGLAGQVTMTFLLIAEHPDRLRPNTLPGAARTAASYVALQAGCLSDAASLTAGVQGKTPLLSIHLTNARPEPQGTTMSLPLRQSSLVSLIHDASLLRIADGAVIVADTEEGEALVLAAASTLERLGYRISRTWNVPLEGVGHVSAR